MENQLKQADLRKELKIQYNIRQTLLGAVNARYYAFDDAYHPNTKALVEKLQYTVVYGCTDSIVVLTNR